MTTSPRAQPCPACQKAAGWDGCARVECPKRRPWGNPADGLQGYTARQVFSDGSGKLTTDGYRKRTNIGSSE